MERQRVLQQLPGEQAADLSVPRVGVPEAIRRHWPTVVVPAIALVAVAVVIGLIRTPVYTASTKLNVGRLDVSAPGALSGFATATQALASSYSRAIDAGAVVTPIARRLSISRSEVRSRLSASPIPESPVFRVRGKGGSEADAVGLANLGAQELIRYTTVLNRSTPDSARLLREYRAASADFNRAGAAYRRLRSQLGSTQSAAGAAALVEAKTEVDTQRLRAQSLQQNYRASLGGQASTEHLQLLTRASEATSDRSSRIQILVFLALIGGLVMGVSLATLRANAVLRRRMLR